MSCKFCKVGCGNSWCPYSEYDKELEQLKKAIQEAVNNKPFKFDEESKLKFTEELIKSYKENK